MRIRAVFFDVDGTLVPIGAREMLPSTVRALDELRSRGIKVIVNTGRPYYLIDNLGGYPFDGYVCMNGGLVLLGGDVVFKQPVDREMAGKVIDICRERDIACVAFLQDTFQLSFHNAREREASEKIHIRFDRVGPLEGLREQDVFQFTVYVTPEEERVFSGLHDLVFPRWSPFLTDVNPSGTSKAAGIARMAEALGIGKEETLAFGDGGNDISMIEAAGLGVAMGNAGDPVRTVADYVTQTAEADGIAVALRHFGLIS